MPFTKLKLTTFGTTLETKWKQGKGVHFTRIAMGDGLIGSGSMINRTALVHERHSLRIDGVVATDDAAQAAVIATLDNKDLTEGFLYRELALMAQDPDTGQEGAYLYDNAGQECEYLDTQANGVLIYERLKMLIRVEQEETISFEASGNPLNITWADIEPLLGQKADLGEDGKVPAAQLPAMDFDPAGSAAAVQTALSGHTGDNVRHLTAAERTAWNAKADGASTSTHISNTNNPHGVTAAQVGALPLSGGTLTGNLDIAKTIASVVLRTGDSSNRLSGRLMKNANVEGTVDDGLYLTDYGADGSEATLKIQGGQQRLRVKLGGTDYAVYHEGSKPTPADIGAIPFDDSRADIPEGADLNSYTAVGVYRCKNNATAGSLTNSPTTDAFVMDVVPSTGTSRALDGNYAYLIQKIMTNGNRYYARKVSTNGNVSTPIYGAWIEFYTTQNKPALADIGAARLICGSYIGTGTAGVSNPCSITFEAAPKLIYLLGSKKPNGVFTWYSLKDHSDSSGHYLWGIYMGALTTVYTENTGFLTDSTELGATSYGKKSSDGKTYYWYVDMASLSSSQQAYGPGLQCNVSGNTYYYAALC